MGLGDWVQSVLGVLGIAATAAVAFMVYRLENRDRRREREEERAAAAQREEEAKREALEREKRAIRREQHKDDYREATQALNIIFSIFEAVDGQPHTEEDLAAAGFEEALQTIEQVAKRVPALKASLDAVWWAGTEVLTYTFPSISSFKYFMEETNRDAAAVRLFELVRLAVAGSRSQFAAARAGRKAVEKARQAIAAEWGA